jgi:peptidoglycan/xylan/chitin deacetylase (PgdA/CDA1 family)
MPSLPDALARPGGLIDRALNRAIVRFGGPRRVVATDTPLVSFTFDDVPDSALDQGAAVLERHGVRGTFYIAGGIAGTVEPARRLISAEGCRALDARGHEVGCHTFSHRRLRDIPGRELAADLDRNAAFLAEAGVARPPRNFAFPYNSAWPPARAEFRRRYRSCRAGGEGINRGAVDPLMLKGYEIRQPEAEARLLTRQIDAVAEEPGWLVFFSHDVSPSPTPYGCTPETLDLLVGHALARGCTVLTVDAALDRLGW